jgi:MarR family multiple antibiotic resistance transcriptional regulator
MKKSPLLEAGIEQNIGFLLGNCNRIKERLLDQYLQPMNITSSQAKVLFHIYRLSNMRQCDIGKKLGVDNSAVTRMIDRLEKKNLLKRLPSETDRREVLITLTEEGAELVNDMSELAHAAIEELCSPLSENETDILRTLLKKLIDSHSIDCLGK